MRRKFMHPKNEAPTEPAFLYPIMGMEEIVSFSHKVWFAQKNDYLLCLKIQSSDLPSKML